MKILIVNQPLNNRGDESALKGLVRKLINEIPDVQIKVLWVGSNQNSINQFAVKSPKVEYLNIKSQKACARSLIYGVKYGFKFLWHIHPTIKKMMKLYQEADYIMCAPGGICMGGFQNWGHITQLFIAKYLKKPIIYYGRSLGPFPTETKDNRKFKAISTELLNYFSFLSIRDKKTELLAQQMGVNYVVTVDSAFLDAPKVTIPSEITKSIDGSSYMVFVPNLLIWHYAYKGRISKETILSFYSKIIDVIKNKYPELKIVMLPQTFNYGSYTGDDIHLFNEIKQLKHDERIVVIPDCYSSDIQQTLISNAKFLIGARYHSVVFALNQAIPFIALSYEHKISGLLETLHKGDCMIDIAHALDDEENIKNAVEQISSKLDNIKGDIQAKRNAKSIADACFVQLKDILIKT